MFCLLLNRSLLFYRCVNMYMHRNKDVAQRRPEPLSRKWHKVLCPFINVSSLLAAVVGRHYQVAVRAQVLDVGGLGADGGYLSLHSGNLKHPAGVMFQQVALEGLPASADSHHHMLVVQHLQKKVDNGDT